MKFQGFAGMNVIRLQDRTRPDYVMILHFDTYEDMARWENSPKRRGWAEISRAVVKGEPMIERKTGLEFWFPPKPGIQQAPPLHKTAIVLVAVSSSLLVTILPLIQLATEDPQPALRLVIGIAIMVVLMTYVVIPAATRLLRPWLSKKRSFRSGRKPGRSGAQGGAWCCQSHPPFSARPLPLRNTTGIIFPSCRQTRSIGRSALPAC